MIIKFIKRHHRGGLKESLETEVYISQEHFNYLLNTNKYHYYAYDERCNEFLWLLNDIEKEYKEFTEWIDIKIVNSTGKPDVR